MIRRDATASQRPGVPWAALLGIALVADAAYSFGIGNVVPGAFVGALGMERLVHVVGRHVRRRQWPWKIIGAELTEAGLELREEHRKGHLRTTVIPGPLILDVEHMPGAERDLEARWAVVMHTILGSVVWATTQDEQEARGLAFRLRSALGPNDLSGMQPFEPTGAVDVIPERKAVMWGAPPVVPATILLRALFLVLAIATLPYLLPPYLASAGWMLVTLTIGLLGFPTLGALSVLAAPARGRATGLSAASGELSAWEHSEPVHTVAVRGVRHIGWHRLSLDESPVAMQLVAHTPDSTVQSLVPRSMIRRLADETFRVVAARYDAPAAPVDEARWSVRLQGGVAEAIEAVSWAQRFVAEGREALGRN